jgi:hypothetical protein
MNTKEAEQLSEEARGLRLVRAFLAAARNAAARAQARRGDVAPV